MGSIALPTRIWFAGQNGIPRKFIGTAVLFQPKLKQEAMGADTDTAIEAF
ncbi:MAG: hypothetical protein WCP36_07440 [Methanomicrobiales archaeon]